jgi:hypothetical protein
VETQLRPELKKWHDIRKRKELKAEKEKQMRGKGNEKVIKKR